LVEEEFGSLRITIASGEEGMATEENRNDGPRKIAGLLPVWVANLWIVGVLVWFFVIRILGSGTAQHLLLRLGLHHGG
jgi:hypothetical protein